MSKHPENSNAAELSDADLEAVAGGANHPTAPFDPILSGPEKPPTNICAPKPGPHGIHNQVISNESAFTS